jgi:hypothetical protein
MSKAQKDQHRGVPGSATAVAAQGKSTLSYAAKAAKAAETTTPDFDSDPNTRTVSHGKKRAQAPLPPKPSANKKTDSTPATHTWLTLHFTGVKPAASALTQGRCIKLFHATVNELGLRTNARASGAARLQSVQSTTNGNLSFVWNANVKVTDVMPHAHVIEKCATREFGVVGRLESPEAWTRIVVEHLDTSDEDGLIDVRRIADPMLQSVIFDGMPKQVMEGPTWMCARDRPVPRTASAQFAVLDPQGKIRERFLSFGRSDGKIDVSYCGVMRKARLFHIKELFSQCTQCWLHGHANGATECKARKNRCARCGLEHITKDHDKTCGKCSVTLKGGCDCPNRCVNCKGAHASNDHTCPARLRYRERPKANAERASFRGGDPARRRVNPDEEGEPRYEYDAHAPNSAPRPSEDHYRSIFDGSRDGVRLGPHDEERSDAGPSTQVEGVSASRHAPAQNGPAVHVTPEIQAKAIAAAEKMRKAAVLGGAAGAAPPPPEEDTRMSEAAPARRTRQLMVTHNGRFVLKGEAIWVASQDPDPIMRARHEAWRSLGDEREIISVEEAEATLSQRAMEVIRGSAVPVLPLSITLAQVDPTLASLPDASYVQSYLASAAADKAAASQAPSTQYSMPDPSLAAAYLSTPPQ